MIQVPQQKTDHDDAIQMKTHLNTFCDPAFDIAKPHLVDVGDHQEKAGIDVGGME